MSTPHTVNYSVALRIFASFIASLTALPALASESSGEFPLSTGDAVVRRTDTGNAPIGQGQTLPDLINISTQRWLPVDPAIDPFSGDVIGGNAHIFRIQLTFAGLINPPGTLGLNEEPYDPTRFGISPLYGFIEIDVDDDDDTGGEPFEAAALRPLAQASRFGGRFTGSIGERQAIDANDLTGSWHDEPQFARSGADYALVFCGCYATEVVFKSDTTYATFSSGQTWIVRGRFFQRSGGYTPASLMSGGTTLGACDPLVNVQFAHDVASNTTLVTFVGALTQHGAALLAGEADQPIDERCDNHTSIAEGVSDLISASTRPGLSGLTRELISRWAGSSISDATNPRRWNLRAIVGTAATAPSDGLYIWTDIGPGFTRRDMNGDEKVDSLDHDRIVSAIEELDGTPYDADAAPNGVVIIPEFGAGFNLYDVNADGIIDQTDLTGYPICPADWDASGTVSVQDIFAYLSSWFSNDGDFNNDHATNVQDIFDFLAAWFTGC